MKMGKLTELIFIPTPIPGHVFATIEMAKTLVEKDERLSATILFMNLPIAVTKSDANFINIPRLQLIDIPQDDAVQELMRNKYENSCMLMLKLVEVHKTHVRNYVSERLSNNQQNQQQIGGFVIDMFCTTMIDVANEFGLPTYVFYTSSASVLCFDFFIQEQADEQQQDHSTLYRDVLISIPCFKNQVPTSSIPSIFQEAAFHDFLVHVARQLRNNVKGIIVNTFTELEPIAIQALSQGKNPPVYPVGPVLNFPDKKNLKNKKVTYDEIMSFLDLQLPSSVVFLCFGSLGCFDEEQVKEIATALEKSEQRFLWALRMLPKTGETEIPTDLMNPEDVLPEGFLERTKDVGRVVGWCPQMDVLSHPSVGGFISHCGWNSTLESIWSGVLIGAWPLYAEQQFNAFQVGKELGMAVNVKMDNRTDMQGNSLSFVSADEIETAIRKVMEMEGEELNVMRKKVIEMKEKSRAAVAEGGSSYNAIGVLANDIIDNIS